MNFSIIRLTSVLILFCLSSIANAQQIRAVSGKVINASNEPLMGNVILLNTDSSLIKGGAFMNGVFEVKDINRSEFLLKLTSLLFSDTIIRVSYNGQELVDLGTIELKHGRFQLNEVQVKSQAALIKYNPNGNIDVNVANTVLATSSSVNEILSRSPNIVVNDGRISVFGKGEAIIYLNGKQITPERMSAIPASQIAKIEIISNPSSRYDAEGKAVINIVTKPNTTQGIMGTVSQYVTTSEFAGSNTNTFLDLTYTKGKFAFIGNYGLLLGKSREVLHTTRTRPATDDYLSSDLQTDWNRRFKNFSNYGLGVQYNIDQRNNISLEYNGYLEDLGGSQDSKNTILTKADNSFYTSDIDKKDVKHNNSVTLNYNRTIDTLGSTLFIGSQYSYYNSDIDDFIDENRVVNTAASFRYLRNNVDHKITISSTQTDYSKVFNTKNRLDLGAKFSYVNTSSGTTFVISDNGGEYKRDEELSNNFRYIEKIPAAYINFNGAISSKVDFSAGLRGEWTNYELNTSVSGGQLISDNYFNLFPNLLLTTTAGKSFRLRASYASRITRPRYQALNPFVVYQDPFTTIEGNPTLIPEKVHAFELGANFRKFDFRIGYNYSIDPIDAAALRGSSPNSYVLKAINLDKGHTYFASLAKTITVKGWTSTNTVNLSYNKLIDNKYNFVFVRPRPQIYLYTNNTFNVHDLFKLQVLAWYLGDKYYGLYYDKSRSTVTVGIEKDFFKNTLKLRILANDIFHDTNASGTYGVGQTEIFYDRTYNTNYFRFIATYSFGRLKKSNYRSKATGQSENNRAN
ncbi:outer membrane beta-barrel family protein [Chitinophaga rhizophila]|uniref:Outer membrane beta-barrel family protein n=1 Tax=Chitinophaga rhizophila TaxID=2866212 RepID=A0ABS7GHJ9_9BACT|nr:outer membrane beta-barrel family protein [Chitinophaga rhizophila]MBW8687174.1 outer membrane beta-barrel family protein [Chitinophaga rhizophila]